MSELIFLSDKTERAFSAVFLLLYAATCTQNRVTAAAVPELFVVPELFAVPEPVEGPLEEAVFFVVATAEVVAPEPVEGFFTAVAFSTASASFAFPV